MNESVLTPYSHGEIPFEPIYMTIPAGSHRVAEGEYVYLRTVTVPAGTKMALTGSKFVDVSAGLYFEAQPGRSFVDVKFSNSTGAPIDVEVQVGMAIVRDDRLDLVNAAGLSGGRLPVEIDTGAEVELGAASLAALSEVDLAAGAEVELGAASLAALGGDAVDYSTMCPVLTLTGTAVADAEIIAADDNTHGIWLYSWRLTGDGSADASLKTSDGELDYVDASDDLRHQGGVFLPIGTALTIDWTAGSIDYRVGVRDLANENGWTARYIRVTLTDMAGGHNSYPIAEIDVYNNGVELTGLSLDSLTPSADASIGGSWPGYGTYLFDGSASGIATSMFAADTTPSDLNGSVYVIDLGGVKVMDQIDWIYAYTARADGVHTVETSTDGVTWTAIGEHDSTGYTAAVPISLVPA